LAAICALLPMPEVRVFGIECRPPERTSRRSNAQCEQSDHTESDNQHREGYRIVV
jgi:hypothetical protein